MLELGTAAEEVYHFGILQQRGGSGVLAHALQLQCGMDDCFKARQLALRLFNCVTTVVFNLLFF